MVAFEVLVCLVVWMQGRCIVSDVLFHVCIWSLMFSWSLAPLVPSVIL